MCVNYITVPRQVCFDWFRTPIEAGEDWREEIYQDYQAPFIIHNERGERHGLLGNYGFVPKRHMPPGRGMTTMNARSETVGELWTYKRAWAESKLCLVPAMAIFEPNWEQQKHERWAIGMADKSPYAVAGIWRSWDEADGGKSHSFTQLTVNADEHGLMRRFHRPDDEKRSVVIIRPEDYDDWLGCRNPEMARAFLQLYPAELLHAYAAPRPPARKAEQPVPPPAQGSLF
ncbi:SOS response-associated peptidase [Massilia sp. YIM B04103]|uniref:SOS response-associated peptidase n=1 Tax=Massilia sp. YIM B04103 TaxID=2963106 RepID=UPI00210F041A|nr:SOS response-associated peptidase family protein [Massilia sp. YIM B04103]